MLVRALERDFQRVDLRGFDQEVVRACTDRRDRIIEITDAGIAIAAITVERKLRMKANTTSDASMLPSTR